MASALNIKEAAGPPGTARPLSASAREYLVVSGDFILDLRSHRATVRGEEILLDEDEFEMLLFLIRHRTNIITPHTRLTTRWARAHSRQSDFLRTLANLQHKLESIPGAAHYIRTESWMVCRFDPGP
jgi:DNA-binding response OmpR family regulator